MAARAACAACAALAACSGPDRLAIELGGNAPGAQRAEVILLDPTVITRRQRAMTDDPVAQPVPERVFYVAQRASASVSLDGEATDGLRLEVQDDGAPYVPLIALRDAGDQVIALGLYNPARVFAFTPGEEEHEADPVELVADLTIYPVLLEPVAAISAADAGGPVALLPGEVTAVACKGASETEARASGLVWRRGGGAGEQQQLRVLLPLGGGSGSAVDRLEEEEIDLDCDGVRAGFRDEPNTGNSGDFVDCDDTAAAVREGATEQCTLADEDCNLDTRVSAGPCPGTCGGPSAQCACDNRISPLEHTCPNSALPCGVPSKVGSDGKLEPCESRGTLAFSDCVGAMCSATLISAPYSWNAELRMDYGVGEPTPVDSNGTVPFHFRTSQRYSGTMPGRLLIHVQRGASSTSHALDLELIPVPGGNCPIDPLVCGP